MIGTLFSLAFALFLLFNPFRQAEGLPPDTLAVLLVLIGTLSIVAQILLIVFAWGPLQKEEQNLTPRILATFKNDHQFRITTSLLTVFFLFTYLTAADLLFLHIFPPTALLAGWTVFLGVAIDVEHHLLKRVMGFLDPFQVVALHGTMAQAAVRGTKSTEICDWIDTLTETAVKALLRNGMSLASLALNQLREMSKTYLELAKSIVFHEEEKRENHVSYILFYLFQRLEMIFETALKQKWEPICSEILTILGKIAIYSAKYDITMANYPLHYLGRLAVKAQLQDLQEVGNRAAVTLIEVSKVILKEVDIQFVSIKEPFLTIIDALQEITQETFRRDKSISIELLTRPFYDLKQLFKEEKAASHQDQGAIIQSIDGVLNQFATLQTVLNTLPPLPEIIKEKEKMEGGAQPS